MDPEGSFRGAIRAALREAGLGDGPVVVGVEPVLPAVAERVLRESHPGATTRDATETGHARGARGEGNGAASSSTMRTRT